MKNLQKYIIITLAFLLTFLVTINLAYGQVTLSEKSKLTLNGIDKIRVGMTVKQAEKAAGIKLIHLGTKMDDYCYYVNPIGVVKDLSFMVIHSKIVRIDVDNKKITTLRGAKIGDTEARIKQLYQGAITVKQHEYLIKGHYLVFMPKDQADKNYRLVFETDGKKVIRFRSGEVPAVEYVEGCA